MDSFQTLKKYVIWTNTHASLYPFYFLVTAFILWIPRKLHKENERGLMEHLTENMALMPISKMELEKLVLRLRFGLFNMERNSLHKYVKSHFLTSMMMPLAVLLICILWNCVLDGEFALFGFRWMSYMVDTYYLGARHVSPGLFYFPPKAACTQHDVAAGGIHIDIRGGTDKRGLSCIIPVNQLYRIVSEYVIKWIYFLAGVKEFPT